MNPRAIRLIEDSFDHAFDLGRYRLFTRELLNGYADKTFDYSGNLIPQGYRDHVALFGRLGTYDDPNDLQVDVLYVKMRDQRQLLRARALQRNFIARHLRQREKDAALVAFYADGHPNWRFSLVWRSEEIIFDEVKERLHFEEELTPARRSSFLVGETEPSHTAKRQFLPILADIVHNPSLAALQTAFSVETVTRDFFDQYKELYLKVHDALEELLQRDRAIRSDFAAHTIETSDFAKKLLGQIVFLYFLQKKGWLGVAPDAHWGSGPTDFMRGLFNMYYAPYTNFFDEVLEPLFYEALARQHSKDLYAPLNVKMPFLNGGLFAPMRGYNWRGTSMILPNTLFSNDERSGAGDVGTGILDVFDRYNFTVHEEAPLEKEVAVDPEMLGKVFENLLEVKDRKSQGAFYTPREIVHYMCQESLINYLDTTLNYREVPVVSNKPVQGQLFGTPEPRQQSLTSREYDPVLTRGDLEFLVRHGALTLQDEAARQEGRQKEGLLLPKAIRNHAKVLDTALANITVCDPAIGSGAFPVGMLHEIVHARQVLQNILPADHRTPTYFLKKHAIQESLYGVDIDTGAIEIARLRLWLSLVVDEDDYREPLPNLGYKIVRGNTVLGGVTTRTLLNADALSQLRELQDRYFAASDHFEKEQLETEIQHQLERIMPGDSFDFGAMFSEVWYGDRAGFDIVIGNPPYVRQERISEYKPELKKNFFEVYSGTADLFVYFYARGIELLQPHGTLAFITSNKFMRAGYGKKLRTFLGGHTTLQAVVDFGDLPVFEATAYPTIVITRKEAPRQDHELTALTVESLEILQRLPQQIEALGWSIRQDSLRATSWALVQPEVQALMNKLRRAKTPLEEFVGGRLYYGIKTGLNEAFVIDSETREQLIAEDTRSAEIIKPWLRGRDIKRWQISSGRLFVILFRSSSDSGVSYPWSKIHPEQRAEEIFGKEYPAIYRHLLQWKPQLQVRQDQGRFWWELRSCAYCSDFAKAKIVYPDIAKRPEFAYDLSGMYGGNTLYIMPTDRIALLGILNSNVVHFFYQQVSSTVRGGFFRFIATYMNGIPIPEMTYSQEREIESRVQELLEQPEPKRLLELESEVNQLVYELYALTPAEITLVEETLGLVARKTRLDSASSALEKLQGRG